MAANPRAAAVAALVRQEQDGFSNLVLDAELKRQQLEGRDKAFASAIFYTVLEQMCIRDRNIAAEYGVSRDTIADNIHWVERALLNANLLQNSVTCVYKTCLLYTSRCV